MTRDLDAKGYQRTQETQDQLERVEEEKPLRLSRAERGLVRRTANRLFTLEHREFPSSSSSAVYTTTVHVGGKVMCNCRGWTIKKDGKPRQCKHTAIVIGDRPTHDDGDYLYITSLAGGAQ